MSVGWESSLSRPFQRLPSSCFRASPRDEIGTWARCTSPSEFLIAIAALSPSHSILASQRHPGGSSGRISAKSKRQIVWLLDPELSTSAFIRQYDQVQFFTSGMSSPCSRTYCLLHQLGAKHLLEMGA